MLSALARNIEPPATIELTNKAALLRKQGIDVIAFSIGEPDFITPENIRNKAKEALDLGVTHYIATSGTLELRESVYKKLKNDNGLSYKPSQICIGNGAKQPLADTIFALCEAGDEVVLPTPCWVSYAEMIRMCGAKAVKVPCREENDFDLDVDDIAAAITNKTKLILINTPNNPTGAVYSEENLRKLADLAVKKNIYVISDEVYEKLIFGGQKHFSLASVSGEAKDLCIVINGFSKTYAMTGWRVGYAAGPEDVIKGVSNIQSQTTGGGNSIAQYAAVEALNGPQDSVEMMRREFAARGRYIVERLNRMEGVSCRQAAGAFYVFPNITACFEKILW
jgi:aspartate aminotransferase